MRKILLISDTHGYLEPKLIKYIQEADEVWHAGDIGQTDLCETIQKYCKLRAVHGNIDDQATRQQFVEHLDFMCEDVKVYMTHIGGYPGKYPKAVKEMLLKHQPQIFICGHSHILKVMYDKELSLLHLNPGAAGVHGFHQTKTALRFQIEAKDIKNLEIIEMGPRHQLS